MCRVVYSFSRSLSNMFVLNRILPLSGSNVASITCSKFTSSFRMKSISSPNKFFMETYGCQMNFSDGEVVHSILKSAEYVRVDRFDQAPTTLLLTCAIREGAEEKIWRRIKFLRMNTSNKYPIKIGVLGCMAEKLKSRLLEGREMLLAPNCSTSIHVAADLVCGPDSYRDLPRLIADVQTGLQGASLVLSLEETYADIRPVRVASGLVGQPVPSALISVMRGCDNMCSYCIVPFVRGRERSRPIASIIDEIKALALEGVKEVIFLGQNVNSYRDTSSNFLLDGSTHYQGGSAIVPGFRTVYRPKEGGLRFVDLLDQASRIDDNIRIRFTSPHPKDFNTQVLQLIAERPNICSQLHLPAQSGSSKVLERMRRGYSREAYLELVEKAKARIPGLALSSDFIAGFCGETEEDHQETLSLITKVGYAFGFCFPFSLRAKTQAYHRLLDDIPPEVKSRRHIELRDTIRAGSFVFNQSLIGSIQLVLIEGPSRRSKNELAGRSDANIKVVFPRHLSNHPCSPTLSIGEYVAVQITAASSQTLRGVPVKRSSVKEFFDEHQIT